MIGFNSRHESIRLCFAMSCEKEYLLGMFNWDIGDLSEKGRRIWFEFPHIITVPILSVSTTCKRCERNDMGLLLGE